MTRVRLKEGKTVFGPVEHPWLDPLWRRIALVVFCGAWTGMEYYLGHSGWAIFVGLVTLYAAWSYLVTYKGPEDETRTTRPAPHDEEG